jgi:hypothetical protein
MLGSSWVVAEMAVSQAGLSSMKLVLVSYTTECIASFFCGKHEVPSTSDLKVNLSSLDTNIKVEIFSNYILLTLYYSRILSVCVNSRLDDCEKSPDFRQCIRFPNVENLY